MALASLLVLGEPRAFAFEHAMWHRASLGAMPNLSYYSIVPYLLDPQQNTGIWHLNHNQAHSDALGPTISPQPPVVGVPPAPSRLQEVWPITGINQALMGIPYPQNYLDNDLTKKGQLAWWIFTNHNEHFVTQASIPLQSPLTYPFG